MSAVFFAYSLAISATDIGTRASGFVVILGTYLAVCVLVYRSQVQRVSEDLKIARDEFIEQTLHELDETHELIAGSLKLVDTFRLVSSRVNGMVGSSASALYLLDEQRSALRTAATVGTSAASMTGGQDRSAAFECFTTNQIIRRDTADAKSEGSDKCRLRSSAAIPLHRGPACIGVLELFFERKQGRGTSAPNHLLESIGTRVSSIVLSSMIFERNQARALTDVMTDLPNERAFHHVLENQVAESQRNSEVRPLAVLAMDIRNFVNINSSLGHAVGDAVINFVARTTQEHLRQMDFFVRCRDDEFLVVLPTATEETAHEVIDRIESAFAGRRLEIPGIDPFNVELNFGWAVFGRDGDTAGSLLNHARLRKNQAKAPARPGTVLLFSR